MKKRTETAKYELIPFEKSEFSKKTKKSPMTLPFYAEVKAAIDNPKMTVEVKWPDGMNCGAISTAILRVSRSFPNVRIRTSLCAALRDRGVFQIMYRGGRDRAAEDQIDVGEPDQEFEIAKPWREGRLLPR